MKRSKIKYLGTEKTGKILGIQPRYTRANSLYRLKAVMPILLIEAFIHIVIETRIECSGFYFNLS